MRVAGWLLIVIAVGVILYNVVLVPQLNDQQARDHPVETWFTSGANLKRSYTFTPPYSGFEIFIFAVGVGGIVLILVGKKSGRKS